MAKTKISEFSATPGNNTDIDSINIAEGCAPSGINDAIRELMAQLKDWQSGTSNDPMVIGSTGSLTLSYGTANGVPYLNGSKVLTSGSALVFDGSNLGLGVTPSAWGGVKAIESGFGNFAGVNQFNGTANAWYNGGNWVYKNTAAATQYLQISGAHQWLTAPSGTAGNAISFTQAMTLDASGNQLLGTTGNLNYSARLRVYTQSNQYSAEFYGTGSNNTSKVMLTTDAGVAGIGAISSNLVFLTGGDVERARIDSSGNLLVGATSQPGAGSTTKGVQASASGVVLACRNAASGYVGYWTITGGSGGIHEFYSGTTVVGSITTNGTSTSFNTSSDYRLKHDIAPMTGALAKVAALKPCTYKWNSDGSDGQGFIAHELAEVCPAAVTGEKDATRTEQYEISPSIPATYDEEGTELTAAIEAVMGEREVPQYQGIDVSFLVGTLTAAIQELNAKFEAYKASHP